ncbi:MAG: cell division protein FtsZ, partial [Bacteroidota bacterium]
RNAAIESKEDIKEMLAEDTKMLFITAGMGGGTGTGAAPVIAQVAKELDILTVGIVTAPFGFEGRKKMAQANEGIRLLKENCDTVLVVLNDKIKEIFGNLPIREAFAQADNVLTTAAKGIAEIITVPGYVNVDFEDVKTVMKNAGAAVMGSSHTSGESRARRAAEMALNSPLLNNQNILGAEKILLSIMSGEEAELQMDELADITDYIHEFAGDEADVIFGHGIDTNLGENIRVTVIATGFASTEEMQLKMKPAKTLDLQSLKAEVQEEVETEDVTDLGPKQVFDLESSKKIRKSSIYAKKEDIDDDTVPEQEDNQPPSFQRFQSGEDDLEGFELDIEGFEEEEDEETSKLSPSFTFEFEKPEQRDTVDFDDDDDDEDFLMEIEEETEEEEDFSLEELLEGPANPISKKVEMMEARRIREEKILGEQKSYVQEEQINAESFREKWDVPAFERKKVKLRDVPHSAERNISKFNLTDDNQIMGNNKFLHDNVD